MANMFNMFNSNNAAFNQDLGNWNVANVTDMSAMFRNCRQFNQDLGAWEVTSLTNAQNMFVDVTLSVGNYDSLLTGWNAQNLHPNVNFSGGNSRYCNAEADRLNMITLDGWAITDAGSAAGDLNDLPDQTVDGSFTLPVITGADLIGNQAYFTGPGGTGDMYNAGEIIAFGDFPTYPVTLYIYQGDANCSSEQDFQLTINSSCEFITTWRTTVPNEVITIPANGPGYNYNVNWGDGAVSNDVFGVVTHTYTTPGDYEVIITGDFPRMSFFDIPDSAENLVLINQWGCNPWDTMSGAFFECINLQGAYADTPNLTNVTNMFGMFENCTIFNHTVNNWDVSNVTNMRRLFSRAEAFNQDLSNWDVGNVQDMGLMFYFTQAFNQDFLGCVISHQYVFNVYFRTVI